MFDVGGRRSQERAVHEWVRWQPQAISTLVKGMKIEDVIEKLRGIDCGGKGTSCPDQLTRALEALRLGSYVKGKCRIRGFHLGHAQNILNSLRASGQFYRTLEAFSSSGSEMTAHKAHALLVCFYTNYHPHSEMYYI
jgi:uncharacterized protein (TIGR03905 family)